MSESMNEHISGEECDGPCAICDRIREDIIQAYTERRIGLE